jgi:hypothetical protein
MLDGHFCQCPVFQIRHRFVDMFNVLGHLHSKSLCRNLQKFFGVMNANRERIQLFPSQCLLEKCHLHG